MWIKTHNGGLTNLALATDIMIEPSNKPHLFSVIAMFRFNPEGPDDKSVLFLGPQSECAEYMDAMEARLIYPQNTASPRGRRLIQPEASGD